MEFQFSSNIPDLVEKLRRRFTDDTVNEAVARGINSAMEIGQELVRSDTPVRTGALRASIEIREADPSEQNPSGQIYSNLHYAPFIEYGTSRGTKPAAMFRKNLGPIQNLVRQHVRRELMELWN